MSKDLVQKNKRYESEESSQERIELLKRTFMKGASDDELLLFDSICKRTGLSPEMKQIHAVPREDWKTKRTVFTFQVSIDGYRLIAERTGCYAPGREPTFVYNNEGKLISATSYVKKMTKDGTWHEVAASAFYEEYVQTFKDKDSGKQEATKFWKTMEHNQLAKCAEALALRKAFPADLSNIYTVDEMAQQMNAEEPEKIEAPNEDKLIEFKKKFKSIENMDYDLDDFVTYVSAQSNKKRDDTLTQALKHDDRFSKSYLKWVEEKIAMEAKPVDVKIENVDLLNLK